MILFALLFLSLTVVVIITSEAFTEFIAEAFLVLFCGNYSRDFRISSILRWSMFWFSPNFHFRFWNRGGISQTK